MFQDEILRFVTLVFTGTKLVQILVSFFVIYVGR